MTDNKPQIIPRPPDGFVEFIDPETGEVEAVPYWHPTADEARARAEYVIARNRRALADQPTTDAEEA